MQKSERLFQLVNLLRGRRLAITAERLAEQLEVSPRTIYRDIQSLSLSGIPVEGEAGVGYRLPSAFQLPPLMFDFEESLALLLGCAMVKTWTDPELAKAAERTAYKIRAILPDALREQADNFPYQVPTALSLLQEREHHGVIRRACEQKQKIQIIYQDESRRVSSRTLWPQGLVYWGKHWTLLAWCELRDDFRNFRVDRVEEIKVLEERFPNTPERSLAYYVANCLNGPNDDSAESLC